MKMTLANNISKKTAHSECQALGELLRSLDGSLVRFIEEVLDARCQTTDDAEWIAEDIQAKHKDVHLLKSLQS